MTARVKRILSGIQPSGVLHIGNYFGMMQPALALQDQPDTQCFYFIADYHALTQSPEPQVLRDRVRAVAVDFLACGLDPEKTVFFRQSDLPQVTEMTWILSCLAPMGLLERCHSYKDKIAKGLSPNHGLFAYPVLMTADILAYQSDIVPVGRDQKQHVEVARDLAIRFNNQYGPVLTVPESQIKEDVAVIPGIDGQKMSKSYNNTIEIFGNAKAVRKTIMRIVTDSTPIEEPKDPDKCNVFALYKLFANDAEQQQLRQRYLAGGMGYGEAKQALYEKYSAFFSEFQQRRQLLLAEPERVEAILAQGAQRARVEADKTLAAMRHAVGLG